MTETDRPVLHTEGVIGDYFVIETHLLSTRSADAYKAIDRSRNSPVCIWMLRFPLALNSDAVRRYLDRMHRMDQIEPPLTDMSAYGVDAQGAAFALFPSLDGHVITGGNVETSEAERRFGGALALLDRLHRHDIACGDLCASSFWVSRDGAVRFLGTMGSFDAEAAATAMTPPADTLPYLAPEQRTGALSTASDVFAIGVLGYYLFASQYPYGSGVQLMAKAFNLEEVQPVSQLSAAPPVWANEVLLRCLDPDPGSRYQSAGAVLEGIKEVRNRAFAQESSPVSRQAGAAGVPVQSATTGGPKVESFQAPLVRKDSAPARPPAAPKSSKALPVIILGGMLAGGIVGYSFFGEEEPESNRLREELSQHLTAVDEELKDAINIISVEEANLQEKQAKLNSIVNSDDPLAHDILVKSAKEADSEQLRLLSQQAIVKRARRLGLHRSAEQARQWLRGIPRGSLPSDYEVILKCLDKTLPRDARNSAIRQAYASNPRVASRLAVALALDLNELKDYQTLISQLVGDSLGIDNAEKYSTLALILAHPDLAMIFGEDVIQKREQIPDGDLLWLLNRLADRSDLNVRAIASMAVERGLLSPVRASFLKLIRDRGDLSSDILNALIRAAAGAIRKEDINNLGRWYDTAVEKILLAILASYNDLEILEEAFDTLAARTLTQEPASELVEWVRDNYWDSRQEFASAVGVLSFLDVVPQEDLDRAFSSFDRFVRDTDLIDILLDTNHPVVLRMVIEKYPDQLGLGTLLDLLDTPDKEVRTTVVRRLGKYNDMGALKLIIDQYERERDEDVRKVYQETFWSIGEREKKK